jgi:GNAT superfamily N-acetyltransferase
MSNPEQVDLILKCAPFDDERVWRFIDNEREAAILRAKLYRSQRKFISLDTLQTHPDYRRRGLAQLLVKELVTWGREERANSINGYIAPNLLLNDTPEHITTYLHELGFLVSPKGDFAMYL